MKRVILLALLASASLAPATLAMRVMRPAREFAAAFIQGANTPLYIRVSSIEDPLFIAALRRGAAKRKIKVLIDDPNGSVLRLAAECSNNLEIHWALPDRTHVFRGEKMRGSFVMELGEGYGTWYGPTVWRKGNFDKTTSLILESGNVYWEESPRNAKAFREDFNRSPSIR